VNNLDCTISNLSQVPQLYRVDRIEPLPQQD